MQTLAAAATVGGGASATGVTCTIFGDQQSTPSGGSSPTQDNYQVLYQNSLPEPSATTLYTVPSNDQTLITEIDLVNTTGSPVNVQMLVNGGQVFNLQIPANGSAIYMGSGTPWTIYNSAGLPITTGVSSISTDSTISASPTTGAVTITRAAISGDVTVAAGSNTATVTALQGHSVSTTSPSASLNVMMWNGSNWIPTAVSGDSTMTDTGVMTNSALQGHAVSSTAPTTTNCVFVWNGTSWTPTAISGDATMTDAGVVTNVALQGHPVSTTTPTTVLNVMAWNGSAWTPTDLPEGMNGWVDVTQVGTYVANPVLTTNTAANNVTYINAILTAAPNGSTIYFPGGIYQFNAAWTMPNKMLTFQGQGSNRAGSPATAFTEIQLTTNIAGTFITLPGSGNGWYTQFQDMTFTSAATQSAGACINVNGNVGTNLRRCAFQSTATGNTWYNVIQATGDSGSNSGNQMTVDGCNFQGFSNYGISLSSVGSSMVITDTVMQGQWGNGSQVAAACVQAGWVGALQIDNSDMLGATNNLLINPVLANNEVAASVFCTNTYFDNSLGSCVKITGTGSTVRTKFTNCSMTLASTASAGVNAIEMSSSFAYTSTGQALDIVGCNVLNTFGAANSTGGVAITGGGDIRITKCNIAGWAGTGVSFTSPISSVTRPHVTFNTIGNSGGYGTNATGISLGAGTYGSQTIFGNDLTGNTTALSDSSTVTTTANNNRIIQKNLGYNPKSTVAQPAVAASGTAVWNSTGVDCVVWVKGGTLTTPFLAVGGVSTNIAAAASTNGLPVFVAANQQITLTYSAAPTWEWIGT